MKNGHGILLFLLLFACLFLVFYFIYTRESNDLPAQFPPFHKYIESFGK